MLAISASAFAIEIPIEGAAEKPTKIAYVNMHKVFEAFPETEKARTELQGMIAQKKNTITEKKEEIADLKAQILILQKQMQAVRPSTETKTAVQENTFPVQDLPKDTSLTAPMPGGPDPVTKLTLREGSPLEFLFKPPEGSTQTAPVSTQTLSASEMPVPNAPLFPRIAVSTPIPQFLPGFPSPAPTLKEKEDLLARKEADLEAFIGVSEQEIRELEEGRTLTLMARIYKSLEAIAVKENYSVVLDKANILYGGEAVDITQGILWQISRPASKFE
jgi:Skp family chaperone for outer membrane proteins